MNKFISVATFSLSLLFASFALADTGRDGGGGPGCGPCKAVLLVMKRPNIEFNFNPNAGPVDSKTFQKNVAVFQAIANSVIDIPGVQNITTSIDVIGQDYNLCIQMDRAGKNPRYTPVMAILENAKDQIELQAVFGPLEVGNCSKADNPWTSFR